MAWKLLAFKPLKPFFFGGEKVFTNTHNAHSEYFPQQTQILGALRLYWMEQNRLIRVQKDGKYVPYEKKSEAINLVGDAGSGNFQHYDNLGCILGISPMFILQKEKEYLEDALFEIPSDVVSDRCYTALAIPQKLNGIVSNKPVTLLKKFDIKKGFVSGFGGSAFWEDYCKDAASEAVVTHDKIYTSYEQVGIGLEHKQTVNKQFYTKKSYMLNDSYRFGLLINIDEERLTKESQKTLQDGIISLGADASMFGLSVVDIPQSLQEHRLIANLTNPRQDPAEGKKIVLLNDAMLESSTQEDAFFQIVSKKIPFKTLQKKSHHKSKEKLLVPKGSVYYFDKPCSLPQAKGAYAKMGYNQYLVLN